MNSALFELSQIGQRRRKAFFPTAVQMSLREQAYRDIAATGDEDNAECAASDLFKEFLGREGR